MRAEIGGNGVCAVCEIGNGWLALSISTCLTTLTNLLLSASFPAAEHGLKYQWVWKRSVKSMDSSKKTQYLQLWDIIILWIVSQQANMQSTIEKWLGLKHVVLLEALCKSAWTGGRLANPGSLEKHACGDTSAKWNVQWVLKKPCHFSLLLFELFYRDLFHGTHTRGLYIASSVLYRVRYWASLLHQKSHRYGSGYVM